MSRVHEVDVIIVGHGLAGAVLAWTLLERGLDVHIIDAQEELTTSKISSGLVTPLTGRRLASPSKFDDFFPLSKRFFQQFDDRFQSNSFHDVTHLRIFQSMDEVALFEKKREKFAKYISCDSPQINGSLIHAPWGGFQMNGMRIDVARFLQVSWQQHRDANRTSEATINWNHDVHFSGNRIAIPSLSVSGRYLVSCEGARARVNHPFSAIRFNPSRGDILRVDAPQLKEDRVLHGGLWVSPIQADSYLIGSTYDWDDISTNPSKSAGEVLSERFSQLCKVPFSVTNHVAGIRPGTRNYRPVIGFHPQWSRLATINGLGSKGVLKAPLLAEQLANAIEHGASIDADIDVQRNGEWS